MKYASNMAACNDIDANDVIASHVYITVRASPIFLTTSPIYACNNARYQVHAANIDLLPEQFYKKGDTDSSFDVINLSVYPVELRRSCRKAILVRASLEIKRSRVRVSLIVLWSML